ncbi:MAG: sugar kinase [Ignavibacteria bacterium]|nr:sugar kinase [Ignavibacteria bacterium]
MSLLIIGSLALDTIETPHGKRDYILGGSANFISASASYFTDGIRVVGTVGYDFPFEEIEFLKSKGIDTQGIVISKKLKTFHWHGVYTADMNARESLITELNVFHSFDPVIPEEFRKSEYVCLGNVDPVIQNKIIKQLYSPELIMIDTMDFWIEGKPENLKSTLSLTNIIVVNDGEARLLTGETNLLLAGKKIMDFGPKIIIIKKGEHGAMLMKDNELFYCPAVPLDKVIDPTGAGDTFAGGFMGWLHRTKNVSFENLKLAVVFGTIMASVVVQDFSLEGLRNVENSLIKSRFKKLKEMTYFNEPEILL